MLKIRMIEWAVIQDKLMKAGYNDVPHGRFVDSYRDGDYLYFMIEFNSEKEELWFRLKWM